MCVGRISLYVCAQNRMVEGIRALYINGAPVTYGSPTEGVKDKEEEEDWICIFQFQNYIYKIWKHNNKL